MAMAGRQHVSIIYVSTVVHFIEMFGISLAALEAPHRKKPKETRTLTKTQKAIKICTRQFV
jgi:hypothetical protein